MHIPSAGLRSLLCALGAAVAMLSGCEPGEELAAVDLTGYWAGERVDDAALQLWLVHNGPDGSIHIRFATCLAGQVVGTSEHFGIVWIVDDVYRTRIQRIVRNGDDAVDLDGEDALQYDYDILELTDARMVYRFIGNPPIVYTVKRVDEDYEMQCPPATRSVDTSARGRRGADGWIRRGEAEDSEDDAVDGETEAEPDPADGRGTDDLPDTD